MPDVVAGWGPAVVAGHDAAAAGDAGVLAQAGAVGVPEPERLSGHVAIVE